MNFEELIKARRAELPPQEAETFFTAVAKRATNAGYPMTRQTVYQIAAGQRRTLPHPDTIKGLAKGMGEEFLTVLDALLHSLGLLTEHETLCRDNVHSGDALIVISGDDHTPAELDAIREAARQAIAHEQAKITRNRTVGRIADAH